MTSKKVQYFLSGLILFQLLFLALILSIHPQLRALEDFKVSEQKYEAASDKANADVVRLTKLRNDVADGTVNIFAPKKSLAHHEKVALPASSADLLKNPTTSALMWKVAKLETEGKFHELFSQLHLDPAKQAKLTELLTDLNMAGQDLHVLVSKPENPEKLYAATTSDIYDDINALLGPTDFKTTQEFITTAPQRLNLSYFLDDLAANNISKPHGDTLGQVRERWMEVTSDPSVTRENLANSMESILSNDQLSELQSFVSRHPNILRPRKY